MMKSMVERQRRQMRFLWFVFVMIALVLAITAAYAAINPSKSSILPIAAVSGLAFTLFFVQRPSWLFWGLYTTSPFNDQLKVGGTTANLRSYTIFIPLCAIYLLYTLFEERYTPSLLRKRSSLLLFTFCPLFILFISKLFTIASLTDLPEGMTLFFPFKYSVISLFMYAIGYFIALFIDTKKRLLLALKVWVFTALLIGLMALVQLIASNTLGLHYVEHRHVISIGRPYGVFREPDVLASYITATFFYLLPLIIFSLNNVLSQSQLKCSFCFMAFFIMILFVRAAWLATFIAFGLFLLSLSICKQKEKRQRLILQLIFGLLAVISMIAITSPAFLGKLGNRLSSFITPSKESAAEYRMNELEAMWNQTYPTHWDGEQTMRFLLGYGDFSWSYWAPLILTYDYDQDAKKNASSAGVLIHPGFCMPIVALHDNGLIGWALFTLFFALLFFSYFKLLPRLKKDEEQALLMSSFLPIAALLVCFLFSYDPITPFFWVQIGLYWATYLWLTSPLSLSQKNSLQRN